MTTKWDHVGSSVAALTTDDSWSDPPWVMDGRAHFAPCPHHCAVSGWNRWNRWNHCATGVVPKSVAWQMTPLSWPTCRFLSETLAFCPNISSYSMSSVQISSKGLISWFIFLWFSFGYDDFPSAFSPCSSAPVPSKVGLKWVAEFTPYWWRILQKKVKVCTNKYQ